MNRSRGTALLQSGEEWQARNRELVASLRELIAEYSEYHTGHALDVGCMKGELTDQYGEGLALDKWWGVDPAIPEERMSTGGALLLPGYGHDLRFPDDSFDCVTFANVYEHVAPPARDATLREIHRVLVPGGILVGQLPNPYFPIESHSRLPFFGCLPRRVQRRYWQFSPTGWDFDQAHFFRVGIWNLRSTAESQGFRTVLVRNFNYSVNAIPSAVAWAAALHQRLGVIPWAWQFVFRKKRSHMS